MSSEEGEYDLINSDSISNPSEDTESDDVQDNELEQQELAEVGQQHQLELQHVKLEKFKPARKTTAKKLKAVAKERSKVWEHFTKYDEPLMKIIDGVETQVGIQKRAQCKYCPTTLKCDSRANGTSSLAKHINQICKKFPGRVNLDTQQTIVCDVLDSSKSLVSRAWSEEACLHAACVMIVLDELPFSSIERPGFLHFCKVAVPRWIPPCRKVIVKNILCMYEAKKMELRNQLRSHRVSLTTDTWTSCQNINYMVVTAHFIDGGWNMHKRVLNFCVIPNHSGISIGKILESCLLDWNLDRILTVTLDNASANKVAVEYLTERMNGWPRQPLFGGIYMHVRCLAHILNLIVRSGLHMINKSVASIRNAVKYVRSSPQRLAAFKVCVETAKIPCKKVPVLDVPTRWNSTFLMLDTALELRKAFTILADEEEGRYISYFEEDDEINDDEDEVEGTQGKGVSQGHKKRVGPPITADWEKASMFVKYLKVFIVATVDISACLKPTSHKAFMNIATIKAEVDDIYSKPLSTNASETDKVLNHMANKMKIKFRKYFGSIDHIHRFYLVALVLDPRYKLKCVEHVCLTMLSMTNDEVRNTSDEVRKFLIELCDIYALYEDETRVAKRERSEENMGEGSSRTPQQPSVSNNVDSLGKMEAMLASWNKKLEGQAIVGGEVDRYLLDPIEKPKDNGNWNILDWWKFNGSKYPTLESLAKDVLALQVSSVASESSFSTGKRVIDPHRSALSPKIVEALICLQNWLKSDVIMGLDYIPNIEEMMWYEDIEREQADEEKARSEKLQKSTAKDVATQPNQKAARISKTSDASKASKIPSKPSKCSKSEKKNKRVMLGVGHGTLKIKK